MGAPELGSTLLVPARSTFRMVRRSRLAQDIQRQQQGAEPLLSSALGKARGQALRLSLVLELLWWCSEEGIFAPPTRTALVPSPPRQG